MYLNVDWSQRADYILRRHGLKPSEAAEALVDPRRLVLDPDPASLSGQSIRVIGWSPGRRELLTVIVVKHQGGEFGANAWPSNRTDSRRYMGLL